MEISENRNGLGSLRMRVATPILLYSEDGVYPDHGGVAVSVIPRSETHFRLHKKI